MQTAVDQLIFLLACRLPICHGLLERFFCFKISANRAVVHVPRGQITSDLRILELCREFGV